MEKPKYFIKTFGCQMNTNDSERLGGLLTSVGFEVSEDETKADLVILNTCSIRDHAEQRIMGFMEQYINRKKNGERLLVAVTGCMAGRDKDGALRKRVKVADLFFATAEMVNLPRWIAELRPEWIIEGDAVEDYLKINPKRESSIQAYISIQTGCNHFCTYCVVPYARGLVRNRPLQDILDEANNLVENGIREITLLGQVVNAYKATDHHVFKSFNPYQNHFAALLWELNQIDGLERIHWTAAHPVDMDDQVIHALTLPKQVNYLHLPVQSGSNEILRKMNRKYTREKFLEIVEKINRARPGIALGTDIIVGFCGETDKDFEETIDLFKTCDFDISYTAQYSPRSGTLAYRLYSDDVSSETKKQRWQTLQNLMEETTLRKNKTYQDKVVKVFVENRDGDWLLGTNEELKRVRIKASELQIPPGSIIQAKITKPMTWILEGEIIQNPE
ncbi:MAG: tRNA (N6-isopentenyl adenosine(37)-C2)-methylthiotransferase MiaB [Patescibacteria group bacterium]|nr:tRNA (N6-isopentenyl adenosine(37)-C2)-methylthiotransferase MiaB [Patescibacteria group bacterium]